MKEVKQDDAVERMLNQLEGLLKHQQDEVRAARRETEPLDDEKHESSSGDAPQPAADRPRVQDLLGDNGEIESPSTDTSEHNVDSTAPERDADDPDTAASEPDAHAMPTEAYAYGPHAKPVKMDADDSDTTPAEMDAYEADLPVAQVKEDEMAVSPKAEVEERQQPEPDPLDQSGNAQLTRRLTTRLGQLLVDTDLLSGPQLQSALRRQQETGERLGAVLVNEGYIDEPSLLSVLESQYGVPAAGLDDIHLDASLAELIPHDMAQRYLLVPLASHADAVDVAMVDPTDFVAQAHVRFATGLRPNVFITTVTAVRRAIARLYTGEGPDAETPPGDPREEVKRMILDRDSMLIGAEQDPRKFYELAASIDAFVDEIFRKAAEAD